RTLDSFYRDCTVFTAPSRYESFGLIYLEAMRWGKPVVACCAGGVPEVVRDGETGLLVPPGDAAALEAALSRLLADADLRTKMGSGARARRAPGFPPPPVGGGAAALSRRTIAASR